MFAKFHFRLSVLLRKILDWAPIFHKTGVYCALPSKNKINTRLAFVYKPNGKEMDQMVSNDIALIAYRSLELLFVTHTFHFNCFFEDLNCVFTQIRCLSRVLQYTVFLVSWYSCEYKK